jgi:hypothetical protein
MLSFRIWESINISGFKFVCEVYELKELPLLPMGERKFSSATLAGRRNNFGGSRVARHWFRGSDWLILMIKLMCELRRCHKQSRFLIHFHEVSTNSVKSAAGHSCRSVGPNASKDVRRPSPPPCGHNEPLHRAFTGILHSNTLVMNFPFTICKLKFEAGIFICVH